MKDRELELELENLKSGLAVFARRQHPDQIAARRIVNDLIGFSREAIHRGGIDPWMLIASHWLAISTLMDEYPILDAQPDAQIDAGVDLSAVPHTQLGRILLGISEDEEPQK